MLLAGCSPRLREGVAFVAPRRVGYTNKDDWGVADRPGGVGGWVGASPPRQVARNGQSMARGDDRFARRDRIEL